MLNIKQHTTTISNKPVLVLTNNSKGGITYAQISAFISANGGVGNICVVPHKNAKLNSTPPVPFGYNGKATGVRALIQNAMLFGVNVKVNGKTIKSNNLQHILNYAKPMGHSSTKPICLLALLNGGYSTSSGAWGTPYVYLTTVK